MIWWWWSEATEPAHTAVWCVAVPVCLCPCVRVRALRSLRSSSFLCLRNTKCVRNDTHRHTVHVVTGIPTHFIIIVGTDNNTLTLYVDGKTWRPCVSWFFFLFLFLFAFWRDGSVVRDMNDKSQQHQHTHTRQSAITRQATSDNQFRCDIECATHHQDALATFQEKIHSKMCNSRQLMSASERERGRDKETREAAKTMHQIFQMPGKTYFTHAFHLPPHHHRARRTQAQRTYLHQFRCFTFASWTHALSQSGQEKNKKVNVRDTSHQSHERWQFSVLHSIENRWPSTGFTVDASAVVPMRIVLENSQSPPSCLFHFFFVFVCNEINW